MDLFSSLYPFVFCSLASGSSGNSYYVGYGEEGILIDAGISARRIVKALADNGVSIGQVKAVFVTHDHGDHIKGLAVLANKYQLPVMATEACLQGIMRHYLASEINPELLVPISTNQKYLLSGLEISAFKVSHDGAGNVGFHLRNSYASLTLATDLGYINQEAIKFLKKASVIILESNYDEEMLEYGKYPYHLKQRIKGDQGHLSNTDAANFLKSHFHKGIKKVFLCHLSQHNNSPELAHAKAVEALNENGHTLGEFVQVLPRNRPTPLFHL
ncbi:MAG: MBL fold metallo-hydrolase [Bacteroidetes bacterium]|nr:MBL fold metallo-hydrolase [Bacteroidota bacterium]MBU1580540.1 MBL fold metallo-hydrolase [Bacteroidota bacterium]MBU2556625.1 MBL fold metallo-hydrolase [Bacteroidota bacterium]